VTELEKQIIVSTKREAFTKAAAALEGVPDDMEKARVLAALAILLGVDDKLIEALGQ
jgi:flagellar hook-basal body complex protein FliE